MSSLLESILLKLLASGVMEALYVGSGQSMMAHFHVHIMLLMVSDDEHAQHTESGELSRGPLEGRAA